MTESRPSPHPVPGPTGAEDADTFRTRRPSRRSVLLGGAAVVVAGAGGAVAGFETEHAPRKPPPNPPPAALVAAAARERALIADLDATTGGTPALRTVLARVRTDHAAHLAAFDQLLAAHDPVHVRETARTGTPRTGAQLRSAERHAATDAANAAAASSGGLAVVLASVSASESSHAALIR